MRKGDFGFVNARIAPKFAEVMGIEPGDTAEVSYRETKDRTLLHCKMAGGKPALLFPHEVTKVGSVGHD